MTVTVNTFSILDLIKCPYFLDPDNELLIIKPKPASGLLWITKSSPYFLQGRMTLRGRDNGRYPYKYLNILNHIFGAESGKTIEVCSGLSFNYPINSTITIDINPDNKPDIVDDAQKLSEIKDSSFNRWRCDPPYNDRTAAKMYNVSMPDIQKLLKAGARVCKTGSLLFLLLGNVQYQQTPDSLKRIGHITISIIPNNELRSLHIYHKQG